MTQITSPTTTTAGWKKRLEARSKISAARLDDVRDRARGQFVGTSSGERARGGVAAAEARLDQFGSTAAGQKISGATRAFGKLVAKVPVLSATADSVSVSNGVDVLKHMTLRCVLAACGKAPILYRRFLEHAAEIALMSREGRGFSFFHGTLQAHFALDAGGAQPNGPASQTIAAHVDHSNRA